MALHLGITQQVIVDLFGTGEFYIRFATWGENARMRGFPRIVIDDVLESAHPPVDPEQIERRRTDEEYRLFVGPEEGADFRDAFEPAGSKYVSCQWNTRGPSGRLTDLSSNEFSHAADTGDAETVDYTQRMET